MKIAAKNMSIVEDDGVGYAAITSSGKIYGEKWLNKEDAFTVHAQAPIDPSISLMKALFGDMGEWVKPPAEAISYDSFGQRTSEALDATVGVILHARKATNGLKVIENVHPFHVLDSEEHPDTALIHNGSIGNHHKLTKKSSTCDSETILHEYLGNMMYHNPWGVEQLAKTLVGEYAVGVLSSMTDASNTQVPVLDVFKSGKELVAAYIPELETTIFCTMEHTIVNSCGEAGLTIKGLMKIKDGYLIRLNAITGERIDDLAKFTTSVRFDNTYNSSHTHSMVRPYTPAAVPIITNAIEETKRQFERKHPSIFTMPYIEMNNKLEENEKALFAELNKGKNTNHKALHLVSIALNSVSGAV